MNSKPEDFLVQAWKQQMDVHLRVAEALVQGATKLGEMQREAAADAHADIAATRRSIAAVGDVARLVELQTQWTRANAQRCAAYWRGVYELASQTQADLARCLYAAPVAVAAPTKRDSSNQALFGLIDNAYKQWFDATQQFYKLPTAPTSR
jgi:phasin family protein